MFCFSIPKHFGFNPTICEQWADCKDKNFIFLQVFIFILRVHEARNKSWIGNNFMTQTCFSMFQKNHTKFMLVQIDFLYLSVSLSVILSVFQLALNYIYGILSTQCTQMLMTNIMNYSQCLPKWKQAPSW